MMISAVSSVNYRPYSLQKVRFGADDTSKNVASNGGPAPDTPPAGGSEAGKTEPPKTGMSKGLKYTLWGAGILAGLFLLYKLFAGKKTKEDMQ